MGLLDFIIDTKDSITDSAKRAVESVKHNGVVQYAQFVCEDKIRDLSSQTVEKIEKATVIVEKAGTDPAVLLHTAKYLVAGKVTSTVPPNPVSTYLAKQYTAEGLNNLSMRVQPIPGSIVYCNLFLNTEHSGVYIGNNQIVHLNRYGNIEIVSPKEFISGTPANAIYVSCNNGMPVGCEVTAQRARDFVGGVRNYNVFFDNCHQFSASCLGGEPDNRLTILTMLKLQSDITLNANQWLHWDRRYW